MMIAKPIFPMMIIATFIATSCSDDDSSPVLVVPTDYISENYESNVTTEATVIEELSEMTNAANNAEANAQQATVSEITYPSNLSSVTLANYRSLVEGWLVELVNAANDDDAFQNPGMDGTPAAGEEGGLLGTRLLDENGLELEQMVQKGSFGAALYNHAVNVINTGDLTDPATIDKLLEIHGTDPTFNPGEATAAATYSRRRSNQTTQTGPFYDIQSAVITARAAIEAGPSFDQERDQALEDYLLAWEKSNFATVIFYCNAAKNQLQTAEDDAGAQGDAMHAYAEGVGFAHGFKGVGRKQISDAEIDKILDLLQAPDGEAPTSYQFLNDASLLNNLDQIIEDIQNIYGFSDDEVATFFVNDPS